VRSGPARDATISIPLERLAPAAPVERRGRAAFSKLGLSLPMAGPAWEQAISVATAAYNESYMPLVPGALHYHAVSVQPYWASSMHSVAKIGNHVFYR
jgi:spore germination cell wall hydrolase CwlJ-like protein